MGVFKILIRFSYKKDSIYEGAFPNVYLTRLFMNEIIIITKHSYLPQDKLTVCCGGAPTE